MTAAMPGQAAYEAYVMAAPDDLNFREPDKLDDWEYPAWEAAAQAGHEAIAAQQRQPASHPVAHTPAVARPSSGSVLVLAVGESASDESVASAVEALTAATEGEGVTVVTVRGVEALRTWEPQSAACRITDTGDEDAASEPEHCRCHEAGKWGATGVMPPGHTWYWRDEAHTSGYLAHEAAPAGTAAP